MPIPIGAILGSMFSGPIVLPGVTVLFADSEQVQFGDGEVLEWVA